jgi:hypothetical protein
MKLVQFGPQDRPVLVGSCSNGALDVSSRILPTLSRAQRGRSTPCGQTGGTGGRTPAHRSLPFPVDGHSSETSYLNSRRGPGRDERRHGRLPRGAVLPFPGRGHRRTRAARRSAPLDVIIAENARNADSDSAIPERGPRPDFPLDERSGSCRRASTRWSPSCGRRLAADPCSSSRDHDSLVVNAGAFRGATRREGISRPPISALRRPQALHHNLGHAARYFGSRPIRLRPPGRRPRTERRGEHFRAVMAEGARGIGAAYPASFFRAELAATSTASSSGSRTAPSAIRAPGRRDLCRKLDRNDRVVGAMLLCAAHGLPVLHRRDYRARCASPPRRGRRIWEADCRFAPRRSRGAWTPSSARPPPRSRRSLDAA